MDGSALSPLTTSSPSRTASTQTARAFAGVEVFDAPAGVLAAWAELEAAAPCSIYQTRAWLVPWVAAFAGPRGLRPAFVLARDDAGRPAALLCLGIHRHGPLRIARWLGGRDANFNLPLLARSDWTPAELRHLLREATAALGPSRPDLYALVNQPLAWGGAANPLAQLRRQPSPSFAYATTLPADAETLFAAKLSKETRKKLRRKEKRLAVLGPVTHEIVRGGAAQAETIDTFLALRNARFREQSIASPFEAPEMRAFIVAACGGAPPGLDLHVLKAGARIVAVYGGAAHQGAWSGMFNAFDTDPAVAPSSPGDLLLGRIVAQACRVGATRFDLGVGAARYKTALCDEEIALFDAFVPMTLLGHAAAVAIAARQTVKRIVKSDPRLFEMVKRYGGRR